MTIQWNEVTWYSKLLAVIIFVVTFALAFCLGMQFQKIAIVDMTPVVPIHVDKPTNTDEYVFSINETKIIDSKYTLKLISVEDSRCPVDVQCIWAGTVKAMLSLVSGESIQNATVEIGKGPVRLGDVLVSLVSIEPTKKTSSSSNPTVLFHIVSVD